MEKSVQEKVHSFFQTFPKKAYKKNEIIIYAQDIPQSIFYLTKGVVKEYFLSQKGEEVVVNSFKPGAFFPMSFAINKVPTTFSFEAELAVEVYQAPADVVLDFVKKQPDVLYDLLRRVFLGTDGLLLRMAYLMAGNAKQRLITELLIYAKRFGRKSNAKIEIVISEKDLASQAGLTRETISRELKQLKERGLAEFSQGIITIPDLTKLEAAL
ncbi:MAG TPA: Crp/Fnr family transcriptional regulator [Patescibacteria group bacterium]|nr:Crp/Fnr family transcriptional regulator [Patescibacteria group bacterium]